VESSGFDHHAPGFQTQLPETYARLRRECPVAYSDLHGGFWTIAAYDDVARRLLGFDPADWARYAQPLHDASYAPPGSAEFIEALERIADFGRRIEAEVDARIATPRADMVSALLADAPDGVSATRDEVVGLVRMTVFGGMDTVMAAMSSIVVRVGRDLELRRALRLDPALIPRAIEEMLRLDAPIQGFARRVTADCTVGSQAIASGETVFLLWASANRDDSVFDRPDAVVLDRRINRHLTFGIGPHFCQGAALAREELRIMLTALLDRIPDFRLVEDEVVVPPTIGIANGFVAVPVEFEPVAAGPGGDQCEGAPGS
jgi:cytochrome P450